MTFRLEMWAQTFPLHEPFVISRGMQTEQATLQLRLTDAAGIAGRGEACGVPYRGDTPETMMADIASVQAQIEAGVDRYALLDLMPPGGARMAIDSALWDIEAKRGLGDPFTRCNCVAAPVATDMTIGIRETDAYERRAHELAGFETIKVKVDARDPLAAIAAVRRGAPDARLIVDPNQSWSVADTIALDAPLADLGVTLLEQPIRVGDEAGLTGHLPKVPICADELIDTADDLVKAVGRFQTINIKLDKTGGLTAALDLADAAQAMGFTLMVGCMNGSSLSMAPAMVIAQRCVFVDLDGPLLQAEDVPHGFDYRDGRVARPHDTRLWG